MRVAEVTTERLEAQLNSFKLQPVNIGEGLTWAPPFSSYGISSVNNTELGPGRVVGFIFNFSGFHC